MLSQTVLLLVNLLFFVNIEAVSVPTKCEPQDSDCVTNSAQACLHQFVAGKPEIGLERSDPMYIKYVDASSPTRKFFFNNVNITGLKDTRVKRIRFNDVASALSLTLVFSVHVECDYEMLGSLLNYNLNGKGPLHIDLNEIEITLHADVKQVKAEDGILHLYYEHKDHSFQFNDVSNIVFENLLEDNKPLSPPAKEAIEGSDNEIIYGICPKLIDEMVNKVFTNFNNFFRTFTYKDLCYD